MQETWNAKMQKRNQLRNVTNDEETRMSSDIIKRKQQKYYEDSIKDLKYILQQTIIEKETKKTENKQ